MVAVLDIIKDSMLTFEQKVVALARCAENSIEPIPLTKREKFYLDKNIICTLFEGNAPYRPRYISVDFDHFMKRGCEFLNLQPPTNIWQATNNLLIFYKHIPSITTMPVYLGNIDTLLDPFIRDESEAYEAIKLFLEHIDRTITDSFCHANLGPKKTKAGKIILQVAKELQAPVPNLTLKFSDETDDSFLLQSIDCALVGAKPSFANDALFRNDFSGDYAIASCYNGLKQGGGSHTLSRVILSNLAHEANSVDDFLNRCLPDLVDTMSIFMGKRIRFLVEQTKFYDDSFLVKEGFISLDNFTAMFGLVGLAECVNNLLGAEEKTKRFGHSVEANTLGVNIIKRIAEEVASHHAPYCAGTDNQYLLHAQVGISSDVGISPGCRIPIGEEPEIYEQIMQNSLFHPFFPSGIGDIFVFDQTYLTSQNAIADIIKGAFKQGMRYLSIYSTESDVIRITGYLVKKSEIAKLDNNRAVLHDTTMLGKGARDNQHILQRKVNR